MNEQGERLQKVLAHLGVASRRAAEALITAGRVSVNGKVVTELGTRVDPDKDTIVVDGAELARPNTVELVTYLLNKPVGVVSTARDPQGRPTVVELVPAQPRVYPVGRLDYDSDGLILLTNDGDLAQQMMHPRHEVEKEYHAWVRGVPSPDDLKKLRDGIMLEGETRPTAPAQVEEVERRGGETLLRFVIHEGRNRQVRRMCEAVGLRVLNLRRVRLGPLLLGPLGPGKWRRLSPRELGALTKALAGAPTAQRDPDQAAAGRGGNPTSPKQESYGPRNRGGVRQPGRGTPGPRGATNRPRRDARGDERWTTRPPGSEEPRRRG